MRTCTMFIPFYGSIVQPGIEIDTDKCQITDKLWTTDSDAAFLIM